MKKVKNNIIKNNFHLVLEPEVQRIGMAKIQDAFLSPLLRENFGDIMALWVLGPLWNSM
jgi:hypothetical protein